MSTHSEPRRWTLAWNGRWVAMDYNPIETEDGHVRVREDKATSADYESVVAWLIENYEAAAEGPRSVLEAEAVNLLAHIFKEGR
jgi:hypothetical protein